MLNASFHGAPRGAVITPAFMPGTESPRKVASSPVKRSSGFPVGWDQLAQRAQAHHCWEDGGPALAQGELVPPYGRNPGFPRVSESRTISERG